MRRYHQSRMHVRRDWVNSASRQLALYLTFDIVYLIPDIIHIWEVEFDRSSLD